LQYGTGAGMFMESNNFKGYLKGNEWFVTDTRYGYARGEVHQSRGCRVIVEHTGGAGAVLSARNFDANVTLNTTARGTAKMAVATNQAYVQVQRGNSDSRYNSAKLDTDYLKFYNGMATGYLDPEDTASGTSYLPAETEYMYISSIPYWNAKLDASAIECDTASAITAIGGSSIGGGVDESTVSAIASAYQVVSSVGDDGTYITSINGSALSGVGGGGVEPATVSAIASAYAESSVSSVSGDYYSTSNPSGFISQGDMFPYVIKSGTSERAVITPTFQDNNINRPTLMVSGYKSSNGKWPRMMVTDYNGSTGYTHSGVLLANAYETYIGTAIAGESGVKTFRMDEYSMDFLPFRVWNTSTQSWYTTDLETYYHTAKYSRYGVTLSALENSGENALFNRFLNSGIYMSSTDYAYLDTADTASGMSATASASAEINIDSINRWNGKQDSSAMTSYVDKSAYDELYSSYTGLSALVSQYSGWFNELSSISAKVDNSAIGVV